MVSVFMKAGRVQACIDYIKFNHEAEGFAFSEEEEQSVRNVLEGEASPDESIQRYIEDHDLSHEYVPPKDEHTFYQHTSCLVNYFSIKERGKLRKVEAFLADLRTAEMLLETVQNTYDFEYLKSIHERMFGDVYPSAGLVRTTVAAKRTVFCSPEFIESAAEDIFTRLRKDHYLKDLDRERFINDLAFYMGELEALHPFRDGNGRAARLFFYQLSMNAGYDVDWSQVDADRLLEADISAIDGDYQLLIDVLEEVVI
ncbi:MAG: Fic/DOC family protein [Sphaerochaeta sp.]|uniref:Fic/DOC family protein n=1 Tax=Sphaerochaeta sp. TaxID=1972642 RepID=UPI002FC78355